jgi:NRAMP (natural resistance-associated macrophage protein)-like metal ion transporter
MGWKKGLRIMGSRLALFLAVLGPGLITANGGNDAGGIATYSMAGSVFGYGFLWVIVWITVGQVVLQEMAARMGVATRKGLTELIREEYGLWTTLLVMVGLTLANFGTTTAEFAGIAVASELFGVSRYIAVPLAAATVWFLVVRGSYKRVEKVLMALCFYAVAYILTAIFVRPPWGQIARSALVPQIHGGREYLLALLATIGTTMTPWGVAYLQASVADKGIRKEQYRFTRIDVTFGAIFGNLVAAFIIICTAATLHPAGIHVETAREAAMALAPIAGPWAETLFAAGLLGASLLAASVLPLSTTYAVCEAFGWERGISFNYREAPLFFGLYTAQIVVAAFIVLIPGIPLFPLMWLSQVANALLLPLVMVLMLRLASNAAIMGSWRNRPAANIIGGASALLIAVAAVALFVGA